ncbi:MAG: hypothetical protein HYR62_10750 [Actinobacteria bacterium]|nr:hypothetical protein [Actinomycetota bacterium]MBI3686786.1 hypothetical protein [Actinomycetota bacterium]
MAVPAASAAANQTGLTGSRALVGPSWNILLTGQHLPGSGKNDKRSTAMLLDELKFVVDVLKAEGDTFGSTNRPS